MAKSDPHRIDSHKMALHPARTAAWLAGQADWNLARDIFPIYVEISPYGACNHACSFCGVDYMLDRPDRPSLAPERMAAMLSEMKNNGVLSVMFAGAGEPLLYRAMPDTLAHANQIGLDTSMTTNGVALVPKVADRILGFETLRWIKVSINAGTAEVYGAIHRTRPADFDRVFANLDHAVVERNKRGSSVTLGAQMVALPARAEIGATGESVSFPGNVDTALSLAKRAKEAGLDYLVIKPYSQHLMSTDSRRYEGVAYEETEAWFAQLEAESTDTFRVVVRRQTMAHLADPSRGYQRCHATPFHWGYVEADGNVWGCSTYLGREEAGKQFGDDRFRYGNVNEASFGDIWRGERRRANWEYVRNHLDISECRVNCRMHEVNLYLQDLLHPGPHHNFI
jgi:MoaA/NifB/PqqE/SkfB family radical SAM enzyme